MAKKILLAEDSKTIQQVVQMTFAAEDYSITAVSDADAAIKQAKEIKPDVVIADLSMEGKNGYDICSSVKEDLSLCHIPVLLLHGNAAPYDNDRGRAVQADDECAKPFETQVLIDKIEALTEKTAVKVKKPIGPVEPLAPPIQVEEKEIPIGDSQLMTFEPPPAAKSSGQPPMVPRGGRPSTAPSIPRVRAPSRVVPSVKGAPMVKSPPGSPPPTNLRPPRHTPSPIPKQMPPRPWPGQSAQNSGFESSQPHPPGDDPYEITIEAEPPPAGKPTDRIDIQSFEIPKAMPIVVEPSKAARDGATIRGVGRSQSTPRATKAVDLPPPPAGLPLQTTRKTPSRPQKEIIAGHSEFTTQTVVDRQAPAQMGDAAIDPAVYEAVVKLSRDVIEKIVWEVVPDLAEKIIREELDRLIERRRSPEKL